MNPTNPPRPNPARAKQMTPEAQRIAIHRALGFYDFRTFTRRGLVARNPESDTFWGVPNYPTDLNAMHEAEKVLDTTNGGPNSGDCLRYAYSRELYELCPEWHQPFRAPANIRAEAFLRTLSLWRDEA